MVKSKAEVELQLMLGRVLNSKGLPERLIGLRFAFGNMHHIISGTVTDIEYRSNFGICIFVSSTHFGEMQIKCIERRSFYAGEETDEVRYAAVSHTYNFSDESTHEKGEVEGTFVLLD